MTQHVVLLKDWVIRYGSDRQLTNIQTGEAVHERANKTLVLVTSEAICTIGYTGTAYMGRYPTDDWLAGAICDPDSAHWRPPTHANSLGRKTIGQVLIGIDRRIAQFRRSRPNSTLAEFDLTILVAGYRLRRRRLLPFAAVYG